MDKSQILKGFNDHFVEFVEDVERVFPDDNDISTVKESFIQMRKANPRLVIKAFNEYFLNKYPYSDGIEYVEQYQDFNNIIRDVAKSENVLIIDLAKEIPQTKDFIYDGIHLNEKGSLLVADIITKFFIDKLEKKLLN